MAYYKVFHDRIIRIFEGIPGAQFGGGLRTVKDESKEAIVRRKIREDSNKKRETKEKTPRLFRINKRLVKSKMRSFFELIECQEFLAFYSVSFPIGISDEDAIKALNIWFTRCRKKYGLFSYIWVAERQKNGTIHFHILTNQRMDIRTVNDFMAVTLDNIKNNYEWSKDIRLKYNGVDVDNVYYSKRHGKPKKHQKRRKIDALNHLMKYITKYCSKGNDLFTCLAWYCSRDISALCVSQYFGNQTIEDFLERFKLSVDTCIVFNNEYADIFLSKAWKDLYPFLDLKEINQIVYSERHIRTILD